jgi:hypothetical protein
MNLEVDTNLYLSTDSVEYHTVITSFRLAGDEVQKKKFLSFLYSSENLSGYGGRVFDINTSTNADLIMVIRQYNSYFKNGVIPSLKSNKPTHTFKM